MARLSSSITILGVFALYFLCLPHISQSKKQSALERLLKDDTVESSYKTQTVNDGSLGDLKHLRRSKHNPHFFTKDQNNAFEQQQQSNNEQQSNTGRSSYYQPDYRLAQRGADDLFTDENTRMKSLSNAHQSHISGNNNNNNPYSANSADDGGIRSRLRNFMRNRAEVDHNVQDSIYDNYLLNEDKHKQYNQERSDYISNKHNRRYNNHAKQKQGRISDYNRRMDGKFSDKTIKNNYKNSVFGNHYNDRIGGQSGGIEMASDGRNGDDGENSGYSDRLSEMLHASYMADDVNKQIENSKVNGKYVINKKLMRRNQRLTKHQKKIREQEEQIGGKNFGWEKYHSPFKANHLKSHEEIEHRNKVSDQLAQMVQDNNEE